MEGKDEIKNTNKKKSSSGIKSIAKKAIKELERIAFSEEEPIKIRMDILKWFTELEVGKPKAGHTESEDIGDKTVDIRVYVDE